MIDFVRTVEREAAVDPQLATGCHSAMHALGRREGRRSGAEDRVPEFPTASSQLCTAGYVHGLAEGYLSGAADVDVAAVFPVLCHATAAREGCAHGIGHALIREFGAQRAPAAADTATESCRDLPLEFPINCANGVYMELALRRNPAVEPKAFVAMCRGASDPVDGLACFGYLPSNLLSNEVEIAEVATWCDRATVPGRYTCAEELGRIAGIDRMSSCADLAGPSQVRERCIDGSVGLAVGSGHVSARTARAACDELGGGLARHCDGAVRRYSAGRKLVESA